MRYFQNILRFHLSEIFTTGFINLRTIFGSQQSVCCLWTNWNTLNTTVLIPNMNSNRFTSHFHCTLRIFFLKKVTPVFPIWVSKEVYLFQKIYSYNRCLPSYSVHFVHREYVETFASISGHQRRLISLTNLLQYSCYDARSVVTPVVSVKAVLKLTGKIVKSFRKEVYFSLKRFRTSNSVRLFRDPHLCNRNWLNQLPQRSRFPHLHSLVRLYRNFFWLLHLNRDKFLPICIS